MLFSIFVATGCGPSTEDLPRLTKDLSNSDSKVRNAAALSLAKLGPRATPATKELIRCLDDDNIGVRSAASFALRSIGTPEANEALEIATKKLRER